MIRSAADIVEIFRDTAALLELAGENKFRARAYEHGADAVEALGQDLDEAIAAGRLTEVPGIGAALASQIVCLQRGDRSPVRDKLASGFPAGAAALARTRVLSARAIKTLLEAGISSAEALPAAAEAGQLRGLRGFTEKTEARILAAMEAGNASRGKLRLVDGRALAAEASELLANDVAVQSVDVVGEVRLGFEVVTSVEILATTEDPDSVLDRFARAARVRRILKRTHEEVVVQMPEGVPLTVHARGPDARAAALQRLTGNPGHNEAFDLAAAARGVKVDSHGVHGLKRRPRIPLTEEQLYAAIGLAYVPPVLRQGTHEVAAALRGPLPRLVARSDLRGVVHCHTTFSDGHHTVLEMATAAQAQGFEYITITDHSPTASYAGGLGLDRLKEQWEAIDRAQESLTIRILRGTESDILKDGLLDYPDSVLERFDLVIASIHNRYRLDAPAMTNRIVRAMKLPLFKIWGHGLGRLLLRRPPVECDVDAILEAISHSRSAIEINGDPNRLDLEPRYSRRAKELGIRFVLSADAHATDQIEYLELAVLMAQRAGLEPGDILNARDAAGFLEAVRPALASA